MNYFLSVQPINLYLLLINFLFLAIILASGYEFLFLIEIRVESNVHFYPTLKTNEYTPKTTFSNTVACEKVIFGRISQKFQKKVFPAF